MTTCYTPEMNETRPDDAVIDATYGGPGHQMLKTPLTLSGRGVKLVAILKAEELHEIAKHKAGWNQYRVTNAAYNRIERQYHVARECLL